MPAISDPSGLVGAQVASTARPRHASPAARTALVFGASGQIGAPLVERLIAAGWLVFAVSRVQRPDGPGLRWLRGDLVATMAALPPQVGAVFSAGPLDHFARWYAAAERGAERVVVFGSTSVDAKRASPDSAERRLAARLAAAEAAVFAAADARGAAATVLRPTLVYGRGLDRNLSRVVALARRFGRMALPSSAHGLRQPAHADDLADAALRCLDAPASRGRAYALPGGETLAYHTMVARTLAVIEPPPRLHTLPMPLFRGVLAAAQAAGMARDFSPAMLARMAEDLVFDAGPAQRDFGYAPRAFAPTAAMFAAQT